MGSSFINRKPRYHYIIGSIICLILELIIAIYIQDGFIRPYLGDALVVGLIYCFVMSVTSLKVVRALLFCFIFCLTVELSQYINLIEILDLQDYKAARLTLGTSFSLVDILMYAIGTLVIFQVECSTN